MAAELHKSAAIRHDLENLITDLTAKEEPAPDTEIKALNRFVNEIDVLVESTKAAINDVHECANRWADFYINHKDKELREQHEKAFREVFNDTNGLFTRARFARSLIFKVVNLAQQTRAHIASLNTQARINAAGDAGLLSEDDRFFSDFSPVKNHANTKPPINNIREQPADAADLQVGTPEPSANIKLPTLKLPQFNGKISEFADFWSRFKTVVHDRLMDDAIKMAYLKSCLSGEPLIMISNYNLTPGESYNDAVATLKRRYGNVRLLKLDLRRQLDEPFDLSSTKSFRTAFEAFEATCRQLKSLGEDTNSSEIENALAKKLPKDVLEKINDISIRDDDWDANKMRDQVDHILRVREMTERIESLNQRPKTTIRHSRPPPINTTEQPPENKCCFCDGTHSPSSCRTVFTPDQRNETAREKHLCFKCLKTHNSKFCNSRSRCKNCDRPGHHTALCRKQAPNLRQGTQAAAVTTKANHQNVMYTTTVQISNPENPQLSTPALAFFDSGSSHSFISENLAKRLDLSTKGHKQMVVNTFGHDKAIRENFGMVSVALDLKKNGHLQMNLLMKNKILNKINTAHVPPNWEELKNVEVKYKLAEPDIIIGSDYFDDLLQMENTRHISDNCAIINSPAGAIVRVKPCDKPEANLATVALATEVTDARLKDPITKLWNLETVGIHDIPTNNVAEVQRIFDETYKREPDGRYTVSWPFCDLDGLPTNRGLCIGRLEGAVESLVRQGVIEQYDSILNEHLENEIIERFDPKIEPAKHFLPHHAVIRLDKDTSKVRGVFDASAKTKDGKSLNDCIFSGNPSINSLTAIFMYSRCKPIVISSDVQSAFLMVNLSDDSKRYCCFLWVKDISKPPSPDNLTFFRWRRMPFGVNASPLLLQLVIEKHLDMWAVHHPEDTEVVAEIRNRIYVDNVIQTADTPEEALSKAEKARTIFAAAKMNLRKFECNNPQVDQLLEGRFTDTKLLGVRWTKDDHFVIGWPKMDKGIPKTKRELLSFTALPFDPAQLISPSILPLKMIIQDLWKSKQSWNESMSKMNAEKIKTLYLERTGQTITLPRQLFNNLDANATYELHIFADSSGKAYGVAAYIVQCGASRQSTLVMAKSRLAPLKPILTIPRLELTALALAGNIVDFIKTTTPFKIQKTVVYTDSTTCLHWLDRTPEGDRFVNNRISKLKTTDIEFRYVPTKLNPADIASRGCSPEELAISDLWWKGPKFIELTEENWPVNPTETQPPAEVSLTVAAAVVQEEAEPLIDPTNFSSWRQLKNVAVVVIKFLSKVTNRPTLDKIPCKDATIGAIHSAANQLLIRQIQSRKPHWESKM
uniref:DUF1758 domain-containing protein n=1 Tax=Panagrellus redivivus TaxID=6233 RepID=A0A7E4UVZ8_PANRE